MSEKTPNTPTASKKKLTEQQLLALATDKNISVTAGAGSGKTTILVERYLKIILEENVDVRKVLAITFTEKAAAEMTERAAKMIHDRLSETSDTKVRSRLLGLRERLNSAQISTIHAFCAKILREFAVASNVDPDFSVVSEFQRELLLSEATEEVFTRLDVRELDDAEHSFEDWKELLRQVAPATLRQILAAGLQNTYEMQKLRDRYAEFSDEALLADLQDIFFTRLEATLPTEALLVAAKPLFSEILAASANRIHLKPKGQDVFANIEKISRIAKPEAQKDVFWQAMLDLALGLISTKNEPLKSLTGLGKKADIQEAYQSLLELSETLSPLAQFAKTYSASVPGQPDMLCFQATRKILYLLDIAETYYRERKEERGLLDFDDLQLRALEMLQNNPEVQQELGNRYRYVMVDEFQDTNHLQWELISLLGLREEALEKDKFFVVGDPKQSIYGFRNADVRVFQEVKDNFASMAAANQDDSEPAKDAIADEAYQGNIVLGESFRFLPSINRFVNFLFSQILGSDKYNDFDVNYDELETRREAGDESYIEAAFLDAAEAKQEGASQEDYIAQTIRKLLTEKASKAQSRVFHRQASGEALQKVQPGDIAILIPRRTHLLELESKLRRYNIPFKTIGGVGFYRRQEIFDVYHLLRYLDNPSDDIALIGILRSPLAGFSDAALFQLSLEKGNTYREKLLAIRDIAAYPKVDQEQIAVFLPQLLRWEKRRDRLSLSQLLNEIFDESFYRATVAAEWNGEQLLANLDKIIEMARDYEQGGFMSLSDFIEMLHKTIHFDPREGEAQIALEDEGTVKIMTVHQAKGLEFPIVFCPYLQQTPRADLRKIRFDADLGLSMKIRNPQQGYKEVKPFLFELIQFRQQQKLMAELKRLFYVAVTRARDHVYLVGSYRKHELTSENCLAWTARALGINPPQFEAESVTVAENLDVQITLAADPEDVATPAHREIEPGLKRLEKTLDKLSKSNLHEKAANQHKYLRPVQDSPKGVTFSATQLLTYKADPDAYFQRYHLGFFEGDYEFLKQAGDAESLSLLKGKIVHQILEDGLPKNKGILLDKLEATFFQYEVFDEAEQATLKKEIPALITPFKRSEFAKRIFFPNEWKIEISLTMKLGDDYFTGMLDRIYRAASGDWEVADYKTNRVTADEVEKAGEKYLMQMKSYAMLMAQLFPDQKNYSVSLYFLLPGKEFKRVYSPQDVEDTKAEFLALIRQIKQYYPFYQPLDI